MKRSFRIALIGAVLAGALAVSAAAADFTNCAEHLDELGLFQGTGQGYALDRAPTRAEAATMLVRLLGKEAEAQQLEYTAPFTDLAGWEKPYVQYLYENGLTSGVSATAFAPERACSAQMYAAFALRALGYTEANGDFTYAEAVAFAEQLGLYDPAAVDTADFLRDDVVAASYTALLLSPKGEDETLLDRLVADGAVDAQTASPYQKQFDLYATYRERTAGMGDLTHYSVNTNTETPIVFHSGDAQGEQRFALQVSDTTVFDREQAAMLTDSVYTLSSSGTQNKSVLTQLYLSDGALYRKMDGSWHADLVTAQQQKQLLAAYGAVPLAWLDEIAQSYNGGWTITFASLPPMYRALLQPVESVLGDLDKAEWHQVQLVQRTSGGRVTTQTLSAAFTLDGVYANPVLVSKLDKTGADAVLNTPV